MAGPPNQNEQEGERVAKAAMFFSGLKILQTMNLCFAGSFPVLLRFGIPPKQIGPFIGITGACLNFGAAMGVIAGFVLGLFSMLAYFIPGVFSIVSTLLLFLVQCRLTHVCLRCSGYDGVHKYFFWLCFSSFVYQGDALLCTATWGWQSNYFFLAMEITNVLIPVVHWIAQLFFRWRGGKDILFWKLCFQLGSMVILTFVCVVLWIVSFGWNSNRKGCAKKTGSDWGEYNCNAGADAGTFWKSGQYLKVELWGIRCVSHKGSQAALDCRDRIKGSPDWVAVISPFFMGIIGMGSIFWLFLVVFPFMVCHYLHFEFTQKLTLVLGALATLIVWGLSDGTKLHYLWDATNGFTNWCQQIGFHDWSGSAGQPGKVEWNATWLILIPVVFFTWIFFRCLHYPRGYFGRCILHSKWAVVWGCIFFFVSQLLKAFGLAGVFFNAIITAKIGLLGNVSFMCSMIHLTASLFTNQAYSDGYSSFKTAVDSGCPWPTQGLGGFRSFCWWHRYGIRNGAKTFFGLRRIDIVAVIS